EGHTQRECREIVTRVLVGDPLGDGLLALEAPARVEVGALATRPDGRAAVRALLERGGGGGQGRAAGGARGDGVPGEHAAAPLRRRGRRLAPARVRARVATIALLTVFAVGHDPAPLRVLLET